MVLLSLVAFAGLGLVIAIRRGHGAKLAGAGLALTAVAAFVTSGYDVRTDDTKTLKLSDHSVGRLGSRLPRRRRRPRRPADPPPRRSVGVVDLALRRHARHDRPLRHRRPPDPVGGARSHARSDPHHRRRRRQRDPGGADLRRGPGRRGRAQPRHAPPADRHVRRVLGQHRQPPQRQLRAGRRTHLPRPLVRRLRPDLVRCARLVRRVQRRDVGRLRALGELPLHARDDRDRVRPSDAERSDGRPVRRLRLRHAADANGEIPRHGSRCGRRPSSASSTST